MPSRIGTSRPASSSAGVTVTRSRRRRTPGAPSLGSLAQLAFLASFLLQDNSYNVQTPLVVNAEPHSTIPRSNNRYTHYHSSSSDSSLDTLSSPLNRESYHPPWNPSPKIDPHGFLSDAYPRSPGEWEVLANIRGRHGPRNKRQYSKLLEVPVRIRQVPGDGNCLFHSIAACLHYVVNGTHLPMDSYDCIGHLRSRSLGLRNSAVDVLQSTNRGWGGRKLFLQGEEYLEASELLNAAAAQFDLAGEEYCDLMRKESYWGGGPEIVALCNYLQRPIHIYELIPAEEASDRPISSTKFCNIKTSSQFTLRRMACFGSPKFDRREPLHILSADSRFPDVEPRRIRKVGNHFLALFPVNLHNHDALVGEEGSAKFRRHALIRGGSRMAEGSTGGGRDATKGDAGDRRRRNNRRSNGVDGEISERTTKWDGGMGSWTKNRMMDWFVNGGDISPKDVRIRDHTLLVLLGILIGLADEHFVQQQDIWSIRGGGISSEKDQEGKEEEDKPKEEKRKKMDSVDWIVVLGDICSWADLF